MKVADSYESLLRGVSQQVPQNRASGQHTEQINMLSDPVNGLTRRHGSVWQAEQIITGAPVSAEAAIVADSASYRSIDWDTGDRELCVMYRSAARGSGADALPVLVGYDKKQKQFLSLVTNPTDPIVATLQSNGVAAITQVGKYLFASANNFAISGGSSDVWASPTNLDKSVVWIRGGAFSRTYKITATLNNGGRVVFTHTTPASSYQGTLNTSDIPANATDYTKQVNDRVNAYNSAVTAWVGTSTAAVQPSAIAQALTDTAVLLGLSATRSGSHICFSGIRTLEVDDGGNGELIRGVADEVGSVDQVSALHFVGKVVKVRSRNASEAYYLKAVAKDKTVTTGYTEVTWVEGAGVEHIINSGLFYVTISGNFLMLASSATYLAGLVAGPHPEFKVSTAGDNDSATRPFFIGKEVTYLGTFQNRLLVGSGGVLACSKTDDYLNFFRSTVLTLPADDPFEMLPQGSEGDRLRVSTLYDQNLVIFGERRQYVINGRNPLTPTSANMAVMASYENAASCVPIAAGGYIFYAKNGESFTSLYQIQPGQNENSPESFPASSQIDSYLQGTAIEMSVSTGSPSIVFLRTTGKRSSLYTFAYLDRPDGRKLDSWSRWDFGAPVGALLGQTVVTDGVVLFSIRASGSSLHLVADFCDTSTRLSSKPYLDSQRPYSTVAAGTTSLTLASGAGWAAAFDGASTRRFTGAPLTEVATLIAEYPTATGLTVGAEYEALIEPTNPYFRDKNGQAIRAGRLTITKMIAGVRDSIGFRWKLFYREQLVNDITFNGRLIGEPNNLVGVEPIGSGEYNIPIGREANDYRLVLAARSWYPFTLTALEWSGQYFNRTFRG